MTQHPITTKIAMTVTIVVTIDTIVAAQGPNIPYSQLNQVFSGTPEFLANSVDSDLSLLKAFVILPSGEVLFGI